VSWDEVLKSENEKTTKDGGMPIFPGDDAIEGKRKSHS